MFRILHFSTPMGSRENVVITQDMDVDANDFCPPNMTLDNDLKCEVVSGGVISSLPCDYDLAKV